MNYDKFLRQVKIILVHIGAINKNTVLCAKSWLSYFEEGFTPYKAVKEDMESYYGKMPFIKWSDINKSYLK